jgi:hypothetical protein
MKKSLQEMLNSGEVKVATPKIGLVLDTMDKAPTHQFRLLVKSRYCQLMSLVLGLCEQGKRDKAEKSEVDFLKVVVEWT